MRPSPRVRCAALACCALTTSTTALVAASATAQSDSQTPSATTAAPTTERERLNVRVGQTAVVAGDAAAGRTVVLQRRGHRGWRTIDRTMPTPPATTACATGPARPPARGSASASPARHATRSLGRLNAYRRTSASWYGPGLYGNHLACGGRLSDSVRGVAHKSLPCGTRVVLRKGDRIVRARVVDRGPFVAGREFDLTPAVKRALGFGSTGTVDVAT